MTAGTAARESEDDEPAKPDQPVSAAIREELDGALERRLHWPVIAVLGSVMVITVTALGLLSWAFYTTPDLPGLVALLTAGGSWLYTSVFALVGLFAGYAGMREAERFEDATAVTALLVSRWAIVAVAAVVAFTLSLVVALLTYDPFAIGSFIAVTVLTIVLLLAFVSTGVGFRLATGSKDRAVLSILTLYVVLVYLWDTTILPMVVVLPLSGDPAGALGTPPGWADYLLALSPSRAHAVLADWAVAGSLGALEFIATLVLLAWLLAPPVIGTVLAQRRYDREQRL